MATEFIRRRNEGATGNIKITPTPSDVTVKTTRPATSAGEANADAACVASNSCSTGICSVTPEQPKATATNILMCVLTWVLLFQPASLPLASGG